MISDLGAIDGKQQSPNLWNHSALLDQRIEFDVVVDQSLEQRHVEVVRLAFVDSDLGVRTKLLVIANENEILERWYASHRNRTLQSLSGFLNQDGLGLQG